MAFKEHLPTIDGRRAARYVFLPEIMPRIRALAGSGFGYFAFLIASVYQMVRILPAGHAYARAGSIGTFGLRDVITEAANHVKLEWRNIDQIVIFFAVLAAIIILFLQFAALLFLLVSGEAFAQDTAANIGFFATEKPENDIAFMLLDHVFGIPDFFGSKAPTHTPFHQALHKLFHFYNFAILIVAALIFVYYIVIVVVETAQSGTPFGQRFNTIYAPLRLVVALGMLVPLNYGLNASQYIVLYSAKVGSGFATNGWLRFNDAIDNPLGADKKVLVGRPAMPSIEYMVKHMALVHACRAGYKRLQEYEMNVYLLLDGEEFVVGQGNGTWVDLAEVLGKTKGKDIKLTFGSKQQYSNPEMGGSAQSQGPVVPYCGVVNIPVVTYDPNYDEVNQSGGFNANLGQAIASVHYRMVNAMWRDTELADMAKKLVDALYLADPAADEDYRVEDAKRTEILSYYQEVFEAYITSNFDYYRDNIDNSLEEEVRARGWGGAGIWYNRIAQWNGEVLGALNALPSATAYPLVTDYIVKQKRGSDASYTACTIFKPNLADGKPVRFKDLNHDPAYARFMYHMQRAWSCEKQTGSTSNILWDAMHMIFGIGGLFDMRCNNDEGVHPLAQLTVVGKGLIDSSVRNMGAAMFTAGLGGALSTLGAFGGDLSAMGQAASGFFVTMATIGLSLGFLLFYIMPFMPFLYFFFAVGAWVKGIFEAMCGAPLWALAHIKIDGDGLPGKSAIGGYFLIFEIFLRPILIVTGLIGGMVIFTASVAVLNEIFDTAVLRLTGIDLQTAASCSANPDESAATTAQAITQADMLDKHILDEFFFTVMYAIFVYMIAMSCFKMIDLVPAQILRFMGGGVTPFASEVQDPTDRLAEYATISGNLVGGKVLGGVQQASAAGGQVIAAIPDMMSRFGAAANKPPSGGSGP